MKFYNFLHAYVKETVIVDRLVMDKDNDCHGGPGQNRGDQGYDTGGDRRIGLYQTQSRSR